MSNLIDRFNSWRRSMLDRKRISVVDPATKHEVWHTHISPTSLIMAIFSLLIIIFTLALTLIGYTPIMDIFPTYKSYSEKSRTPLIESIKRIDSMEQVLLEMVEYNNNIALIMDGKTPVVRSSAPNQSEEGADVEVAKIGADSALRAQMEGDGEYSLNRIGEEGARVSRSAINFTSPIDGIITDKFDLKSDKFGVKIAAQTKSIIYAADKGVVLSSVWSPDNDYSVEIIHSNGFISIYKNLSQTLVEKGQVVNRGEVIGYNSEAAVGGGESKLFEFELWMNGNPVNAEAYIIF